jgi:hypothetical protein
MPPILDDNIEDLEPSTDPNLDDTAQPNDTAPADDAKSSAATDAKSDDGLLSVVRDVVAERKPAADTASSAEGEEGSEGAAEKPKQDDENYSDVPFHKHPRFQHLHRKMKAFEQDAVRYHNVQNFLDQSGLSAEEAADGLAIMGMAKTDPAQAWQRIKPFVQKLLVAAGEVLPEDLNQRVTTGEMSREAALELSRSRAAATSLQAAQSFREQQAQRRSQTESVTALQSAAQVWEDDRRAKDPNFDAKYEDVMKEVHWLIQKEGRPTSPQGVRAQLQKAYKAVNDRTVPAQQPSPQRPAIRPITGGQVAGGQQMPRNASTLDIVRANRRAS